MAATTTTIIGTTRSRTDRFLKYRAAARGSQGSAGGYGMYSGGGAGAEANSGASSAAATRLLDAALGPPSDAAAHSSSSAAEAGQSSSSLPPAPAYVAFKDAARRDMARIRAAMAELRELHSRAALVTFDDDSRGNRDAEVSRATAAVTRLFRDCEARLSAVGRDAQAGGAGGTLSEADERVRQNVKRTLAAELQQLSLQFRKQQRGFLEKLRAQQQQQGGGGGGVSSSASSSGKAGGFDALLEGASRRGGGGNGNFDDDFDDGSAPYVSTTSAVGFTQKQQARVGALDTLAREREAEIERVVESISQLSEIMKDLGEFFLSFFP